MFKKLRNRFLLLNMIMISVLLICSFSIVFTMVYFNIDRDIYSHLDRSVTNMMMDGRKPFGDLRPGMKNTPPGDYAKPIPPNGDPGAHDQFESGTNNENNRLQAQNEIRITIGKDGGIISVSSSYYSDDFCQTVADEALSRIDEADASVHNDHGVMKTDGTLKSEGSYWKYVISRDEIYSDTADFYIAAKNIDSEVGVLEKLAFTLICVLLLTLILVFLICLYFANRSIKPIEAAWEKQNQFIADASHELKTPLTTINTNIDVLLAHGDCTIDSEKKWLMYIKDESTRMAKLTNDLLYLAKIEHNSENKTVFSAISLTNEVRSVLLTMEAVIYERNLTTEDNIKDDIVIKGDNEQIKQLVMILLDNAIKYTPKGGKITVTLSAADKHAVLSVRNTGDGIPPEDAEKIFDRFYRSDKSRARSSGGYGLGLAIAKSIAASHGGTIKLSCARGKYTEFIVRLPIKK